MSDSAITPASLATALIGTCSGATPGAERATTGAVYMVCFSPTPPPVCGEDTRTDWVRVFGFILYGDSQDVLHERAINIFGGYARAAGRVRGAVTPTTGSLLPCHSRAQYDLFFVGPLPHDLSEGAEQPNVCDVPTESYDGLASQPLRRNVAY